jgi:uncharacterized protein (TIGR03663 family)
MQINPPNAIDEKPTEWLDKPLSSFIPVNWETILFTLIILVAVATRFFLLENRVMSHDETSHVYFSWMYYKGQGYAHDPITHGPFQFHIVALSYFLFGDNDFTARIPAALFGIASVIFLWNFRRYLGRSGALVAAFLFLISPYMLYYARYVRNESFVALFGLINIWAMLRYFETGKSRYLIWLTAATVFHFITKETSYIYTAQTLLFLALFFVYRISIQEWPQPRKRNIFFITAIIGILFVTSALLLKAISFKATPPTPETQITTIQSQIPLLLVIIGLLAIIGAAFILFSGYTLARVRSERSFDMAVLLGTLVLPLLSAFVINLAGWKIPVNAGDKSPYQHRYFHMALIVIPITLVAIGIGLWWNPRQWLINAALFYGIFTVFYTSLFTNGAGFFTGLVGSLGYWLAQQEVNRGSQPWFYYTLICSYL